MSVRVLYETLPAGIAHNPFTHQSRTGILGFDCKIGDGDLLCVTKPVVIVRTEL
jgi:hypothetical protein